MWFKILAEKGGEKHRLVCCGHAGSTYAAFIGWKKKIDRSVELLAVSLPGRCERISEEPISDLDYLAKQIAGELIKSPPLPTTIYGHSFGGALAYEIAIQLQDMGYAQISSIIVSACSLSGTTVLNGIDETNEDAVLHAFKLRGYLSDEQAENIKLMELVMPYLLSDILCKEGWQPSRNNLLQKPIHSFAWNEDVLVSPAEIQLWSAMSSAPKKCVHKCFSGGHLEYLNEPDVMFKTLNRLILTAPVQPKAFHFLEVARHAS